MFKTNLSVKESLDHLASRLDPIITARLAPHLHGLPWTHILEILDEKRGTSRSFRYRSDDLQAQLRILTERLGDIGFPFDNDDRIVSTLGSELRIVRKRSAHNHQFTALEAFRAADFAARLLRWFQDEAGLAEAARIRLEALKAVAEEHSITVESAEQKSNVPLVPADSDEPQETNGDESVTPDPEVLSKPSSLPDGDLLGAKRLPYEPWEIMSLGDPEVLDRLRRHAEKEEVRSAAVEIATYEGPIHLHRLASIIARSFGVSRLSTRRKKSICHQVRQAGLFVDSESFVWPREIDPTEWLEFRPNDSSAPRQFDEISPREIANAARFIKSMHPEFTDLELETEVLKTFGRKNRTRPVLDHLRRGLRLL